MASTAFTPRSTSRLAADTTGSGSPWATAASSACGEKPLMPASSSALGLMRSGAARSNPSTRAANGDPRCRSRPCRDRGRASRRRRRTSCPACPAATIPTSPPRRRARRLPTTERVSASMAAGVQLRAGFVDFGCGAVHFGDRDVGPDRRGEGRSGTAPPLACRAATNGSAPEAGSSATASDAGERQCARDVDALAAGLGGHRADPVHRAAGQRRGRG